MTFREFMQRYKKKRKRIEKFAVNYSIFRCNLSFLAEEYLKKSYNAGYLEGLGEGFEKGWNECQSVHKVIDKVKVIEVKK